MTTYQCDSCGACCKTFPIYASVIDESLTLLLGWKPDDEKAGWQRPGKPINSIRCRFWKPAAFWIEKTAARSMPLGPMCAESLKRGATNVKKLASAEGWNLSQRHA